jgi:hypothetical protein
VSVCPTGADCNLVDERAISGIGENLLVTSKYGHGECQQIAPVGAELTGRNQSGNEPHRKLTPNPRPIMMQLAIDMVASLAC